MLRKKDDKKKLDRKKVARRPRVRIGLPKDTKIDYKSIDLLLRVTTTNGKIMSRRFTGANSKQQRDLTKAAKQAKFLALVPVGSSKRFLK
ncbi:MAG: 30S ribosomal protein S18 [Candidatus Omnitrophica bacterium]|nr:30S ribosomal protein S18 [Candidatus Omnitrophota bacterium]